jgi:subtilisin family serine protease
MEKMDIMKHSDRRAIRFLFALMAFFVVVPLFSTGASAQAGSEKAPPPVLDAISFGRHQDIIVLMDDAVVQQKADLTAAQTRLEHDISEVIAFKSEMFGALKQDVISLLPVAEFDVLKDYNHLPMMFIRVKSINALERLLEQGRVLAVYEDARFSHFLSQSLILINQPQVANLGKTGSGTTVAVLDTGVNYTNSAFGTCTLPVL